MSTDAGDELVSFQHFLADRVAAGAAGLSPEKAVDLWRAEHPVAVESGETILAVREALADMEAGDTGKPLAEFCQNLRGEIKADQRTLEELIEQVGAEQGAFKQAGAWVAEKFSRGKMRLGEAAEDQLGFLHALEALMLGITGKRGLWTALAAAAADIPQLRVLDFAALERRAIEQGERVETKRREVARKVLSQKNSA